MTKRFDPIWGPPGIVKTLRWDPLGVKMGQSWSTLQNLPNIMLFKRILTGLFQNL